MEQASFLVKSVLLHFNTYYNIGKRGKVSFRFFFKMKGMADKWDWELKKISTTYCGITLPLLWDFALKLTIVKVLKSCTVNEGLAGIHRCVFVYWEFTVNSSFWLSDCRASTDRLHPFGPFKWKTLQPVNGKLLTVIVPKGNSPNRVEVF